MKVASFFSGCGGLDLGFEQAGVNVVWANDIDSSVHDTYCLNHPNTIFCKADIRTLHAVDIPVCDGFIGGPPCQSWSEGGKQLGINDERGRLFLEYIRLIKEKHPKFFIIENVKGILSDKHLQTFLSFLSILERTGYTINYSLLNAADYRIPQDRYRVFVVGFLKDLNCDFSFPKPLQEKHVTLRESIGDIVESPKFYLNNPVSQEYGRWFNHDVFVGSFDAKFMARNRVRAWDEVSFTIQAQAKNCPLHPQAPPMKFVSKNQRIFVPGYEYLYRRLSVRECARIQSFPDSFHFLYTDVKDGYKMVGNAVPPRLARMLALSIINTLSTISQKEESVLVGYYKNEEHLRLILQNKLYYVRTGFRRGALQMPMGAPTPQYLLLHNRKDRKLYKLLPKSPITIQKAELIKKGFSPSGNEYYAFYLETSEPINIQGIDLYSVQFKCKNRDVAIPYVVNISELK